MIYVISVSLSGGHKFLLDFKSETAAEKAKKTLEDVLIGKVRDTALCLADHFGKSVSFRPSNLVAVGSGHRSETVNVDIPAVNSNGMLVSAGSLAREDLANAVKGAILTGGGRFR